MIRCLSWSSFLVVLFDILYYFILFKRIAWNLVYPKGIEIFVVVFVVVGYIINSDDVGYRWDLIVVHYVVRILESANSAKASVAASYRVIFTLVL
mmetsp:Transcript_26765/g.42287  ORF Transcript_26765/g.42287 Transcript_26765/m.42287 type:complete len:95 (+) Transcript_26765:447-731(+)